MNAEVEERDQQHAQHDPVAERADVFLALANEGVDKFEKSWTQLWNTVTDRLGKAGWHRARRWSGR